MFSAQAKPKAALQERGPRKRCELVGLLLTYLIAAPR
jgi:hypothetical protein